MAERHKINKEVVSRFALHFESQKTSVGLAGIKGVGGDFEKHVAKNTSIGERTLQLRERLRELRAREASPSVPFKGENKTSVMNDADVSSENVSKDNGVANSVSISMLNTEAEGQEKKALPMEPLTPEAEIWKTYESVDAKAAAVLKQKTFMTVRETGEVRDLSLVLGTPANILRTSLHQRVTEVEGIPAVQEEITD